jgi:hypothetical protein
MVPVDPACVPEGYEAERVSIPRKNESYINQCGRFITAQVDYDNCHYLIVRPIPKPIRLPTTIVPPGWWVAKDGYDRISIYELKPILPLQDDTWIRNGGWCLDLAPPIAAQLPAEYLALPWDQSLLQQTEGM